MVAKKDRNPSNPKNTMLRVRVADDLLEKLDEIVGFEKTSRSHVIRESIERRYEEIKKER